MLDYFDNKLCIQADWLIDEGILSFSNYKLLIYRKKLNRLQRGGNGRKALIEYSSIPERFRKLIVAKLGYDPSKQARHHFFRQHIKIDKEALTYFANYQLPGGGTLKIEKQKEYYQNAVMLNTIDEVYGLIAAKRKNMGGRITGIWDNLTRVINDLREEYGHTLPGNTSRLKNKLKQYKQYGYDALIHRGFGNINSRKVNEMIKEIVFAIYIQNNKPYPVMVRDIYLEFLAGKIDIVKTQTGEMYNRNDFFNEKGKPIIVTEATIRNILNNPKNRAIVDSLRNDRHYFNNLHRPHHHRKRPRFSLSKISLDDRDLPYGKYKSAGKELRALAYYAYDVASGALIGAAYSREKNKNLFIATIRDMFAFLNKHDMPFPLELEVEHHLVNQFADDLMMAGKVFEMVRFCNPGNSQEKRAEHFHRQKKYGYEKRWIDGIGRFHLTEANRPKQDKIWDENGMHIKNKIMDFDELVALDRFIIKKYNNGLHPDQKTYPGKTRLQVLLENVNPNAVRFQTHIVAKYAGIHRQTSIRRNQYVRVNYANYQLPDPNLVERLESNNYKVDAYYIQSEDGNVPVVYLFQNGNYLAACQKIERYNEATAEQTAADLEKFEKQSKYVAKFDSMIREGRKKIPKVSIISAESDYTDIEAEVLDDVVVMEPDKTDDWDKYANESYEDYAKRGAEEI